MCHHLSIFGLDSLYNILHILTYYNYAEKELHELFNCSTCAWTCIQYFPRGFGVRTRYALPTERYTLTPERFQSSREFLHICDLRLLHDVSRPDKRQRALDLLPV